MTTDNELWRPVVGYEGMYEVSNLGRVRSLDRIVEAAGVGRGAGPRTYRGKMLRVTPQKHGIPTVSVSKDGIGRVRTIRSLMDDAFPGLLPKKWSRK